MTAPATTRLCWCGCGRSLEGRRSDAKWFNDACRKRGPARLAAWARGLTEPELEAVERRVSAFPQPLSKGAPATEIEELIRNRRPGDDDSRRRNLRYDPDHAGTPGAWDHIWNAYRKGKDSGLNQLMHEAERMIRPAELTALVYERSGRIIPPEAYGDSVGAWRRAIAPEESEEAEVVSLDELRDQEAADELERAA
jgi:hypothetical protein